MNALGLMLQWDEQEANGRSKLDFFHINFTIVWLILAVELIT